MDESSTPAGDPLTPRQAALRDDLNKEYYAILEVVSAFDGRILTVKGWSVTLSLAALGLGFQQEHYALFGLAAATATGFWYIDVLLKGYQLRYYLRMRDIELAAYHLNQLPLPELGKVSAPRIDMSWGYHAGRKQDDWRTATPPGGALARSASCWRGGLSRSASSFPIWLPSCLGWHCSSVRCSNGPGSRTCIPRSLSAAEAFHVQERTNSETNRQRVPTGGSTDRDAHGSQPRHAAWDRARVRNDRPLIMVVEYRECGVLRGPSVATTATGARQRARRPH